MAGGACAVIPQIRNRKTGKTEDSALFKDIGEHLTGRPETIRVYLSTKSEQMASTVSKMRLDDRGEPLFESLVQFDPYKRIFTDDKLIPSMERKAGFADKDGKTRLRNDTMENRHEDQGKAVDYNNSHQDGPYRAMQVRMRDKDGTMKTGIRLYSMSSEVNANVQKMTVNHSVNQRLRDILSAHGISVGSLDYLEQRRGIAGITDFSVAADAARGIATMIRLMSGEQGEARLPEEFSHFAIRALKGERLVERLINNISSEGVVRAVLGDDYDRYYIAYNGDEALLAEEAAGKMLADRLAGKPYEGRPTVMSLFGRAFGMIRDFFRQLSADEVTKAVIDAEHAADKVARGILYGNLSDTFDTSQLADNTRLFSLADRIERDKGIITDIIDNTVKRISIYEKTNKGARYSAEQRKFLDDMQESLDNGMVIEGMQSFLGNALNDLAQVKERMLKMIAGNDRPLNTRCGVMRDARNFIFSYSSLLDDMRTALNEEVSEEDNRFKDRIDKQIDEATLLFNDVKILYRKASIPLLVEWIKPYLGECVEVPFGKFKGKRVNAEELIRYADKDIGFMDRWLDSMAESSDIILKIFDQETKKAKEAARLQDIEDREEIVAAGLRLEKAGYRDTEWMFERDSEGHLTGRYISDIDYSLFDKNVKRMEADLAKKYGENPEGENLKRYYEERRAWFKANLEYVDGVGKPTMSKYRNRAFDRLDSAQREFYDTIMRIKSEKDSMLPEGVTRLNNAVKIRKDLMERVKSSHSLKNAGNMFVEAVKDQFIRRCDDTDLDVKPTLQDFEGHEVQTLPIFYTKLREGESNDDLSTDVVSTMVAYCSMANNYNEMSNVINTLEMARDILRDNETGRQIQQTSGNRKSVERINTAGRELENMLTKRGEGTNFINRLNDYFSMQVYSRYIRDAGTLGDTNIEVAKLADVANQITSLHVFALNLLAGISNVATGTVMMRIDSVAREYFTMADVRKGDSDYAKSVGAFVAEIGSNVKTSKLGLFDELFNVMQEHEQTIGNTQFDRKGWFSKMFQTNTLYFMSNAGEHWMQNRTALALANTMKFKDGAKEITLWDAYETVPYNGKDMTEGARLQMRRGLVDSEGNRVVTREELRERAREKGVRASDKSLVGSGEVSEYDLIRKFSRRSAAINQRMHGVYNKLDRNALQSTAIGRMAIMFRKWMRPSYKRRFGAVNYNYDLGDWEEGYYITSWRFAKQLVNDIRTAQFDLGARWQELNKTEKANIRRAVTEMAHLVLISAAATLLAALRSKGKEKDKNPWYMAMLEYQMRRLRTEIGALTPTPIMANELWTILKSPMAAVNTLEQTAALTKLLWIPNYLDTIQAGKYKGHSSAYRAFMNSPLVPMYRTIRKAFHPEEAIPFYKQ